MPRQTHHTEPQETAPPSHLEQFASYADGEDFVVCDRKAPSAWIRSDETVEIRA